MATKYIVDNLTQQTITGNVTITRTINENATYRALLTQTGTVVGTSIGSFGDKLIIGETYTIGSYATGDDFSNIGNVTSGTINETGCVFTATGPFPTDWSNGSELTSNGGLIVDVLENTLGYDLQWEYPNIGLGPGAYVAWNNTTGPLINAFPRNNTHIISDANPFNIYAQGYQLQLSGSTGTISEADDSLFFGAWDWIGEAPVDNALYYAPIEIKIKQDLNVTPITVSGSVLPPYPFGNISISFIREGNTNVIDNVYGDNVTVNNISELVGTLNQDPYLSYFGTYTQAGASGINLSMRTNLKNQICPNGTLIFEVFAD